MLSQIPIERRGGLRVPADVPARVYFDGCPIPYRVVELSTTGARLYRRGSEAPPMVCTVELELDRQAPLRMRARTVWSDGAMCGLRFVDGADVDRLEIAERIDELFR